MIDALDLPPVKPFAGTTGQTEFTNEAGGREEWRQSMPFGSCYCEGPGADWTL